MNKLKRKAIFAQFCAQNPHPRTELIYHSVFELLIAVMLSAQATDVSVNKVTAKLFLLANSPQGFVDLGEDNLKSLIKTIGLFNSKAKHILQTCRILLSEYHGQVPESIAALQALPGVGRKTANVVLNAGFGTTTMPVDTHVFRVANRTGLACGKTPLAVEQQLLKTIDKPYLFHAHHWLVLHGRYTCTARKPRCQQCIIREWCEFKYKTGEEDIAP